MLTPTAKIETVVDLVRVRLQQDPDYDVPALWRELEASQRRDLIELVDRERGPHWRARSPQGARFGRFAAGQ